MIDFCLHIEKLFSTWYYVYMIDKYFEQLLLTSGNTYDNYTIFDCPVDFISYAKNNLSKNHGNVKSCNIEISEKDEKILEPFFESFDGDFYKKLLARDYVYSLFMLELLKDNSSEKSYHQELLENINNLNNGDTNFFKIFHLSAPMEYDLQQTIRKLRKIELNIFCIDNKNKFIQQAINNLISSRSPYSIKLFTTNSQLPTYYDQGGNLIESPHDYIQKNFKSLNPNSHQL